MANNTNWLNISQLSGGTGVTPLSLTALTNDSLSAKTATITAYNNTYNVSGTSTVMIEGFVPTLTLSRSTIRFDYTGGTATFTVYSNTAWTIEYPSLVQSYSVSAGTGDTEVTIAVAPNPDQTTIIATGTVKDVFNENQLFLTIVQELFISELTVTPDSIEFDNTGSTTSVTIESNCDWEIVCPDWITASVESGTSGTTTITFTAGENGPTDRSGNIIVYYGSTEAIINAFQPFYVEPHITVTPSEYTYPYSASTYTFVVDSYPEWEATVISTGETIWDETGPYVDATFEIPSALTMNVYTSAGNNSIDKIYVNNVQLLTTGASCTFPSGGTYRVRFILSSAGTAPVVNNNYLVEYYASELVKKVQVQSGATSLRKVTVNAKELANNSFRMCNALTSVTIGNNVLSAYSAFSSCSSITNVSVGSGLTYWTGCFAACSALTSATIENGIGDIAANCFNNCTALTQITIPESVRNINSHSFANCNSLSAITIPENVSYISSDAFTDGSLTGNCFFADGNFVNKSSLTSSTNWGATVYADSVENNGLVYSTSVAHKSRRNVQSVQIPNGILAIADRCFYQCTSLSSVTIPNSVETIGADSFASCTVLNRITCYAVIAPSLGVRAFLNIKNDGTLFYPTGSDYSTWFNSLPSNWTGQTI